MCEYKFVFENHQNNLNVEKSFASIVCFCVNIFPNKNCKNLKAPQSIEASKKVVWSSHLIIFSFTPARRANEWAA